MGAFPVIRDDAAQILELVCLFYFLSVQHNVHFLSCNGVQFDIQLSHDSTATNLRRGSKFHSRLPRSLTLNLVAKELLKWPKLAKVIMQIKVAPFNGPHSIRDPNHLQLFCISSVRREINRSA